MNLPTIEKHGDSFLVKFKFKTVKEKQKFLLISDLHFDSPLCDRKLLKKHLEQAKEQGAGILMFGDIFDVMSANTDRRSTKGDVRPEYIKADHFGEIQRDFEQFITPYKDNVLFLSPGNHELSNINHQEINILSYTAKSIGCQYGKYLGFIRFNARCNLGNTRRDTLMFYTHGKGGNSPVTGGVLNAKRRAAWVSNADIIISGHLHKYWNFPVATLGIDQTGKFKRGEQTHVQLAGYKDPTRNMNSWDMQGEMLSDLGGAWLEFTASKADNTFNTSYEIRRAN